MFGLVVIEVMTLLGLLSNINEMSNPLKAIWIVKKLKKLKLPSFL